MKAKDIIGEIDPDQKQCTECKNYYHQSYIIVCGHSPRMCKTCYKEMLIRFKKEEKDEHKD